jgi:hypothetical protein
VAVTVETEGDCQTLRRRNSYLDCDQFKQLVAELDLKPPQVRSVYRRLVQAKKQYEVKQSVAKDPCWGAVREKLDGIEQSILRLIRFSEDGSAANLKTLDYMSETGEKWAFCYEKNFNKKTLLHLFGKDVTPPTLAQIGINRIELDERELELIVESGNLQDDPLFYDIRSFLFTWFRDARFIIDVINMARGQVEDKPDLKAWINDASSPKAWLYGVKLPSIYEYVCERRFTISKEGDQVRDAGGIAFAIRAGAALGLSRIRPETAADYRKQALKRKQPQSL